MVDKILRYLYALRSLERVNISITRGGVSRSTRALDERDPSTWEFSGFSQNGEDGIIEVILSHLKSPNRYFVEIGASDGLENNTSWLALVKRYGGLWIEGDPDASQRCRDLFAAMNYGVSIQNMFATKETIPSIISMSREKEPDLLSIDIDGNDYHIADALLAGGLRPKVCVVEYNSAFGPEARLTVPYVTDFRVQSGAGKNLFYGCSLAGWKSFFERNGYRFITVDANGVNAFFARPEELDSSFVESVRSRAFAENTSQSREYGAGWEKQFGMIDRSLLQEIQ